MVSETGSGYRAGGADLVAGCIRQGRSRGSICVYRTTRVRDRRCSDAPAIIALRLAPIRPSRQHYAHLLVRCTPPPSPAAVRRIHSGCQQRAPRADARVAMGRLPGNKSRAEARSLGDNVVSGTRTRRQSQEHSPTSPVPLPHLCCSLLPQCCANAQAAACSPPAVPCAFAQFADEAPPRPSVRPCLASPARMPSIQPPALPPNPGDAAYLEVPDPPILTPMLPAVPGCPPPSPSPLVQWANLILPLRTRLPSLCSLRSRGRRPAGGIRRPVPRSQT